MVNEANPTGLSAGGRRDVFSTVQIPDLNGSMLPIALAVVSSGVGGCYGVGLASSPGGRGALPRGRGYTAMV